MLIDLHAFLARPRRATISPTARGRRGVGFVVGLAVGVACSAPSAVPVRSSGVPPVSSRSTQPSAVPVTPSITPSAPPAAESIRSVPSHAAWTEAVDRVVGTSPVSVAVGSSRRISYLHLGEVPRIPASAEKLLTSMVALDTWGAGYRFPTEAVVRRVRGNGVVPGDLWIVGSGDPTIDAGAMDRLAARIDGAGIDVVRGSVVGDTSAFTREWWAPGWVPGLSRSYVNRTTALAFDGNAGTFPEREAAASLVHALEARGIEVRGTAGSGRVPAATDTVARIRSEPLGALLTVQNHGSVNFYAETILKAIGAEATGGTGSTAAGAAAVESWLAGLGLDAEVRDGSGLSHRDRIAAADLVTLLLLAAREPWGDALRTSLPGPGEGTIGARLTGLDVHAKTGTLFVTPVSALAGSVVDPSGREVAFAIVSRGLGKTQAIQIEDAIVRILATGP